MSAPAYRSTGTVAQYGFGNNINNTAPGLPSGWQENDIFILITAVNDSAVFPTAPGGWTALNPGQGATGAGGTIGLAFFWKRAGSSESAPTVTYGGVFGISAVIIAISGASRAAAVIHQTGTAQQAGGAATTVTCPAVTTAVAECLAVMLGVAAGAVAVGSYSGSPTPTERADTNASGAPTIFAATFDQTSAGSTSSRTATLAAGSARIGQQIAIMPDLTLTDAGGIATAEALGTDALAIAFPGAGAIAPPNDGAGMGADPDPTISLDLTGAGAIASAEAFGTAVAFVEGGTSMKVNVGKLYVGGLKTVRVWFTEIADGDLPTDDDEIAAVIGDPNTGRGSVIPPLFIPLIAGSDPNNNAAETWLELDPFNAISEETATYISDNRIDYDNINLGDLALLAAANVAQGLALGRIRVATFATDEAPVLPWIPFIEVTDGANGVVTVAAPHTIDTGFVAVPWVADGDDFIPDDVVFTLTSDSGFKLGTVLVDDIDVTLDAVNTGTDTWTYTFVGVAEDHTIAVAFIAD